MIILMKFIKNSKWNHTQHPPKSYDIIQNGRYHAYIKTWNMERIYQDNSTWWYDSSDLFTAIFIILISILWWLTDYATNILFYVLDMCQWVGKSLRSEQNVHQLADDTFKCFQILNENCRTSLKFFPWASCQIRKIADCAYAGNAGNVFPAIAE